MVDVRSVRRSPAASGLQGISRPGPDIVGNCVYAIAGNPARSARDGVPGSQRGLRGREAAVLVEAGADGHRPPRKEAVQESRALGDGVHA
jgi:hypothetical protein